MDVVLLTEKMISRYEDSLNTGKKDTGLRFFKLNLLGRFLRRVEAVVGLFIVRNISTT